MMMCAHTMCVLVRGFLHFPVNYQLCVAMLCITIIYFVCVKEKWKTHHIDPLHIEKSFPYVWHVFSTIKFSTLPTHFINQKKKKKKEFHPQYISAFHPILSFRHFKFAFPFYFFFFFVRLLPFCFQLLRFNFLALLRAVSLNTGNAFYTYLVSFEWIFNHLCKNAHTPLAMAMITIYICWI